MAYQKNSWRDYDETKTELQNMQNGAVVTPERLNHMETGIANSVDTATFEQNKVSVEQQLQHKRDRTTPITEYDISDTLKQQITGNAPVLQTVGDGVVTPKTTTFIVAGKNLFNLATLVLGHFVVSTTGALQANASYDASDFIPVLPNTSYVRSTNHQMALYDGNKQYISGDSGSLTFTTPAGTAYVRVTVPKGSAATYQIERGTVATAYEPFSYNLDEAQVNIISGTLKTKIDTFDQTTRTMNSLQQDGKRTLALTPEGVLTLPSNDLKLWFKADGITATSGTHISTWKDDSGNGYDVSAADLKSQPKFVANRYNGLPVVEFSTVGTADPANPYPTRLRNNGTLHILNGAKGATVFIVAAKRRWRAGQTGVDQIPLFVTAGDSSSLLKTQLNTANFFVSARRLPTDTLVDSKIYVEGLVNATIENLSLYEAVVDYEKGTYELVQDGRVIGHGSLTTTGTVPEDVFSAIALGNINSTPGTSRGFDGDIGEIILYKGVKAAEERSEVRNYLLNKWGIDTMDGHYTAKYSTTQVSDIASNNESLDLIAIKTNIDEGVDYVGYLYLNEATQKLYYSPTKYDNPHYLFDWNSALAGGAGCENYVPVIAKNGDIVFMGLRNRTNPIVYKHGAYNAPVVVDFGTIAPPGAGLMDVGVEYDYEHDFFIFGEYLNPSPTGGEIRLFKVTSPFENASNWKVVMSLVANNSSSSADKIAGSVKHFHTVKKDPFSNMYIANTGDADYQCRNFVSKDLGETWVEQGNDSQDYRMTGLVFAEDGAYWGNDTQVTHALFKAHRKPDGYVDFSVIEFLSWLSVMQPTYRTCYLNNPHGLLFLDRGEVRTDLKLDLTFWDFDKKRLYRLDVLDVMNGETGEDFGRLGFGNQAVTAYETKSENAVICGSTTNPIGRPMTLAILGNDTGRRVGNTKIEVLRK